VEASGIPVDVGVASTYDPARLANYAAKKWQNYIDGGIEVYD